MYKRAVRERAEWKSFLFPLLGGKKRSLVFLRTGLTCLFTFRITKEKTVVFIHEEAVCGTCICSMKVTPE